MRAETGIRLVQAAVKSFNGAFEQWEKHDCVGAQIAITVTDKRIPAAVEKINYGMEGMMALI